MTALESAINDALKAAGNSGEANKAYLEFIKANFIIPIDKNSQEDAPEVLFLTEDDHSYLPVFSSMEYFEAWAQEISGEIKLLRLSGVDLLKGIGDDVTVCLNTGSGIYKEFNPAEMARMRSMVIKLFKN